MICFMKILFCFLLLLPCSADAQNPTVEEMNSHIIRIKQTPDFEITGDGSARQWINADWVPVLARNNPKTSYHANVKLLYSSLGIYCLFSCEDRKITATLKENFADLYNEDVVEIFFWPDEAVPVYFEYEISPNNYELAILVPNLKGNAYGWRPWHYEGDRTTRHATKITTDDKGVTSWTAEFFIPYSLLKPLLKTPPQKGSQWRANMYRIDYDEGVSYFSWQPTRKNFHDYEKFGTIQFD
jgi:Carbohydrate family 9 binding domain-like